MKKILSVGREVLATEIKGLGSLKKSLNNNVVILYHTKERQNAQQPRYVESNCIRDWSP